MKKAIRALIGISIILCSISSCFNAPQERVHVSNIEFLVEKLFTVDSCNVYRFFDGGRAVYFTSCKGVTTYHTGGKEDIVVESINETK